ncbi:MAG: GTP 3',8-cyclase MoaA [Nanoarchaeota archaeon]
MKNSLRISLTSRCNFACDYCHEEGYSTQEEMSIAEIQRIVSHYAASGISRVKLTGGEPMLRKDILDIIRVMKAVPGIREVSMVTNGYLLDELAMKLKEAGLDRVNIGCDSLLATDKNAAAAEQKILAAKKAGLIPIHLNMVVLKGINDHEISGMMAFAKKHDCILKLIELINVNNDYYQKHYFSLESLESELGRKAETVIARDQHNTKQYFVDGCVVEVVRPFSPGFCSNCTKIRVTADGKYMPCLVRQHICEVSHGNS